MFKFRYQLNWLNFHHIVHTEFRRVGDRRRKISDEVDRVDAEINGDNRYG